MSRVLALGSDAPTIVALAGGTLARLVAGGSEAFISEIAPQKAGDLTDRDHRGARVAATLGATWLGVSAVDGEADGRPLRDPVMDVIRQARPDLILVSSVGGVGSVSHGENIFNAIYCAIIPNYRSPTGLDPSPVRAPILHIDEPASIAFRPDQYVDISESWERKLEALEAAGVDPGNPIRHLAETSSRARGIQVQVEFAEAFRTEYAWGRLRAHRLLP